MEIGFPKISKELLCEIMKDKIRILGINGSPHKGGLCAKLLAQTLRQSRKHDAEVAVVHLVDYEKYFFHSHYKKRAEKGFGKLAKLLKKADGFIFISPTHWMNVSSLMKNFLDQLTLMELKNFDLEGKVAGFIATEEEGGAWNTLLNMVGPLNQMGLLIPPHALVFYSKKLAGRSEKKWMKRDVRLLGKNIVDMVKLTRQDDEYFWDYKYLK